MMHLQFHKEDKNMKKTKKDEEIVQIVVNCPKRKIQKVVALLYDMGATATNEVLLSCTARRTSQMMEKRKENRALEYADEFWKTDNEFVQKMRDAYADGISFTKLSRFTGLTRTTLYRYLHGESFPNEIDARNVLDGIDAIYEEIKK
jgi:DNA-binding phage protein